MKLRRMKHRLTRPICYTLMWWQMLPNHQWERHQRHVWFRHIVKPGHLKTHIRFDRGAANVQLEHGGGK